jgi:hypothetical protein
MIVEEGKGYVVNAYPLGEKVTRAFEGTPYHYGSISPSEYAEIGDNVSIAIEPRVIREATPQELSLWDNWYSLSQSKR